MSDPFGEAILPEADLVLRTAVERIVRPIVATESRKMKMRRELYAHAVEAYADEATRDADPLTAAQRAAERLGTPVELTAELQAGVSMANRREARLDRWIRRDPATPPLRHAATVGLLTAAVFLLFLLTVLGIAEALDPGSLMIGFSLFLAVWFGAGVGIGSWFGGKIRDVLSTDGLRRVVAFRIALLVTGGFVALLVTGFGVLAILLIASHGWSAPSAALAGLPPAFLWSWTALCAVIALAAAPIAWLDVRERAGLEEWLALELE